MREGANFQINANPAFMETILVENLGKHPMRAPKSTLGQVQCCDSTSVWRSLKYECYWLLKYQNIDG